MTRFEREAVSDGFSRIAGVDEVGRGPLSGPVVAAAVLLAPDIFESYPTEVLKNPAAGKDLHWPYCVKDSKKLTPKKRQSLLPIIYENARAVGVGIVWPGEIDKINILQASLRAMEKAVLCLCETRLSSPVFVLPDFLLIDGPHKIKNLTTQQRPVVSGDSISLTIACASIVAKTARDSIMRAYHKIYPQYNFMKNKGYGTAEHIDALRTYGPTPIHRKTFRGVSEFY